MPNELKTFRKVIDGKLVEVCYPSADPKFDLAMGSRRPFVDESFDAWPPARGPEPPPVHAPITSGLVHGVFNHTLQIRSATERRLTNCLIGLQQFRWVGSRSAPDFDLNDPETVVVLNVTLGNLAQTAEFAWKWVQAEQTASWRLPGLEFSPDKFRLLQGSKPFEPWTLQWRRIKLDANIGKKPVDVRSPQTSPGTELFLVAAQHPERVRVIDYKTRLGWFTPGLECTAPGSVPWLHVLCVGFYRGDRQVRLHAHWYDDGHDDLGVPVFLD